MNAAGGVWRWVERQAKVTFYVNMCSLHELLE